MNNQFHHNLQSPQMQQGAPAPQANPHPQTQPQQSQAPSYFGVVNVQLPLVSQPNLPETSELFHMLQRSSKENLVRGYQLLLRTYEDAGQRNHELYRLVKSRESDIKTLGDNEAYMRAQLGALQQRNVELEHQIQTLNGENQELKTNAVSKTIHDEVLDQNKAIAGNNHKLVEKNEVLWSEAEYAKADAAKRVSEAQKLGRNIIELNKKLAEAHEKNIAVQSVCDGLIQKNGELLANLEEQKQKLAVEEVKVKNLEEKLLCAETLHKSTVEELNNPNSQIINLKFALESARDKVSSLMNECQVLEKKVESLEGENKTLLDKQKEHDQLINIEKELVNVANIALQNKQEEVESLEKQLREEKALSETKSEVIASVKMIMQNGESIDNAIELKEVKDQVGTLQLQKEELDKQLDTQREDIRKLQSEMKRMEQLNEATATENVVLSKQANEMEKMLGKYVTQLEENASQRKSHDEEINRQRMTIDSQAATLDSLQGKVKRMKGEANEKDRRLQVLSYQQKERERDNNVELKRKLNENRAKRQLLSDNGKPVPPNYSERKRCSIMEEFDQYLSSRSLQHLINHQLSTVPIISCNGCVPKSASFI